MVQTASQTHDPLIGQTLAGQFVIDALIAKGGMGNIYLAHQARLGRPYCIKILRAEFCQDAKVVKRFLREALAVSQLRHPHTIQIFDHGETPDGVHYIVMEYLEGESLDRRIAREGALEPNAAISFVAQCAAALAEAHSKGIVHRDLKPANIFLVTADNVPEFAKLLDFGIAKFYTGRSDGHEFTKLTAAGSTMGTPHYMSPEQIRGEDVDGRADIYSLGVILWETLCGRPPHNGDAPMEIFLGHLEQPLPLISEVAPAVPDGFDMVVARALAKNVRERFASMSEFKSALDSFTGADPGRLATSQRVWLPQPSGVLTSNTPTAPETKATNPDAQRRTGLILLVTAAAIAALVILVALVALLGPEDVPEQDEPTAETSVRVPTSGTVKIYSEPPAAHVLIDGAEAGDTPIDLARDRVDPLKIELRADGYQAVSIDIVPVLGQVRGVAVALAAADAPSKDAATPMQLWLESSPPGAEIHLNGRATGFVTPYNLNLVRREGAPTELSLVREGFMAEHYAIAVRPGGSMALSTKLVPAVGKD